MRITAERYHDFSCGHRVFGHEGKCALFHGHNYRVTFVCEAAVLDSIGRVLDFSVIKERLCEWLEAHWDHKFLLWDQDPCVLDIPGRVNVPFNPTAENMAEYLLAVVGPSTLTGTGVTLVSVRVEETRKCSATASKENAQCLD